MNLLNLKRIMSERKSRLPSQINHDWKPVKALLTHISTKNIAELNELIYARAKLVCEKKLVSPKEHEQKLKSWRGNSTGNAN